MMTSTIASASASASATGAALTAERRKRRVVSAEAMNDVRISDLIQKLRKAFENRSTEEMDKESSGAQSKKNNIPGCY